MLILLFPTLISHSTIKLLLLQSLFDFGFDFWISSILILFNYLPIYLPNSILF